MLKFAFGEGTKKCPRWVSVVQLLICPLALLIVSGTADGWTWRVPDDFSTITDAIEYYVLSGDTVVVAPGVYDTSSGEVFPIDFFMDGVVLISDSGPSVTVIDANSTGRVFACDRLDSTTVIDGFTITGGSSPRGGGIFCDTCFMEIRNNIVRGNSGNSGGGIYCNYGAPRIVSNRITDNVSPDWCGGGVYCFHSTAIIDSNVVARNIATFGAGIFNDNSATTIRHNFVKGNRSRESGGGLDCYTNSSPLISHNVVVENISGTNGAGIACCYNCAPTITHNTIVGNVGDYGGGVRSLGNSSPTISSNVILDNVDGVYLTASSGQVTATGNHLYLNTRCEIDDYEVVNNTIHTLDLTDNFWGVTDSLSIDSLVYGPGQFIPCRPSLNDSIPGEPSSASRVEVMSDSTYTEGMSGTAQIGDTLYIQLEGEDWNGLFMEPALVVISSCQDTHGIGVALIETGASTGIYRGVADVRASTNDTYNWIGVNANDTIIVRANVSPHICDTVLVQPTGVETDETRGDDETTTILDLHQNHPNPFTEGTNICFSLPGRMRARIRIYDMAGRLVTTLVDSFTARGYHTVHWNGADEEGQTLGAGVYFCELSCEDSRSVRKMLLLR